METKGNKYSNDSNNTANQNYIVSKHFRCRITVLNKTNHHNVTRRLLNYLKFQGALSFENSKYFYRNVKKFIYYLNLSQWFSFIWFTMSFASYPLHLQNWLKTCKVFLDIASIVELFHTIRFFYLRVGVDI